MSVRDEPGRSVAEGEERAFRVARWIVWGVGAYAIVRLVLIFAA